MPERPDETPPKPFRIQRLRLGKIRYMQPEGEFGFIDSEDFRDDVFFHHTVWESEKVVPQEKIFVEFELDDDHRVATDKLRAKVVRPTRRPEGKTLSTRETPELQIKHHPNARKKRPTWRG
ncbi:MAG: cold shock domain-containing protein [Planctomycetota bacterium]